MAAAARLRQECVDAKEALSADSDVSIPVLLPELQTEVRLTRAEYEQMVRPALADTITSLTRALRSAGVEPGDVTTVLLVGGSSRTPLVAELVSSALGGRWRSTPTPSTAWRSAPPSPPPWRAAGARPATTPR